MTSPAATISPITKATTLPGLMPELSVGPPTVSTGPDAEDGARSIIVPGFEGNNDRVHVVEGDACLVVVTARLAGCEVVWISVAAMGRFLVFITGTVVVLCDPVDLVDDCSDVCNGATGEEAAAAAVSTVAAVMTDTAGGFSVDIVAENATVDTVAEDATVDREAEDTTVDTVAEDKGDVDKLAEDAVDVDTEDKDTADVDEADELLAPVLLVTTGLLLSDLKGLIRE